MKYCIVKNIINICFDMKHYFFVCILWLYAHIKDIIWGMNHTYLNGKSS